MPNANRDGHKQKACERKGYASPLSLLVLRKRPYLSIVTLVALLVAATALAQVDWQLLRNTAFRFRFLYPPDWYLGTPRGTNVRATLFPPGHAPNANCNIVV